MNLHKIIHYILKEDILLKITQVYNIVMPFKLNWTKKQDVIEKTLNKMEIILVLQSLNFIDNFIQYEFYMNTILLL